MDIPIVYLTLVLVITNFAWAVACFYLIMVNQNILKEKVEKLVSRKKKKKKR